MTGVILYTGLNWSIHPKLKQNLDIMLNDVKQSKMDLLIVLDGGEGLGKSFQARGLGTYCATYLGCEFGVDDIYFDIETYISNSLKAGRAEDTGKHKINVLDEGRHAIHRARGGGRGNVRFTNYLSECRDLGQVHIILAPAYHDLDKYVILWRMAMLIHSLKNYKEDHNSETGVTLFRGEYKAFINNASGKRNIAFYYEQKQYQYPKQYEVHARWPSAEVFTEEQIKEYQKKKYAATMEKYYKEEEEKEKEEAAGNIEQEYVRATEFGKKYGLKSTTISKAIQDGRLKGKKVLKCWFVHRSHYENPPAHKYPTEENLRRKKHGEEVLKPLNQKNAKKKA